MNSDVFSIDRNFKQSWCVMRFGGKMLKIDILSVCLKSLFCFEELLLTSFFQFLFALFSRSLNRILQIRLARGFCFLPSQWDQTGGIRGFLQFSDTSRAVLGHLLPRSHEAETNDWDAGRKCELQLFPG